MCPTCSSARGVRALVCDSSRHAKASLDQRTLQMTGYALGWVQQLIRDAEVRASKLERRWAIDRWSLYLCLA